MTTPTAPPGIRCTYCGRQPTGRTARLTPGDPASPLVDVGHPDCYDRFLAEAAAAVTWPTADAR